MKTENVERLFFTYTADAWSRQTATSPLPSLWEKSPIQSPEHADPLIHFKNGLWLIDLSVITTVEPTLLGTGVECMLILNRLRQDILALKDQQGNPLVEYLNIQSSSYLKVVSEELLSLLTQTGTPR